MRDEVRDFLDSLRESQMELAVLHEQIEQLTAAATRVTTTWKEAPVSSHGDPHKDGTMVALADAKTRLTEEELRYAQRIIDVTDFIGRIESVTYRLILTLRYINCKSWPEVTAALEQDGVYYTDRHVRRLHGKALNAARRLWAEEHKEET